MGWARTRPTIVGFIRQRDAMRLRYLIQALVVAGARCHPDCPQDRRPRLCGRKGGSDGFRCYERSGWHRLMVSQPLQFRPSDTPGYRQPTPEWSRPSVPTRTSRLTGAGPQPCAAAYVSSVRLERTLPTPFKVVPPAIGLRGLRASGRPRTACLPLTRGTLCQVSYRGVAAGQGFEPQLPDPGSGVLPLDHPALVGEAGVEPATITF